MRRIRFSFLAGLLTVAAVALVSRPGAAPEPGATIELTAVRYPDLVDRIKALRGKVAVVDFWADYCPPCKREFPRLVELHRKYAQAGVACVSVDLDDAEDAEARSRVRQFLTSHQAAFANFLLTEKPKVWQAKLKIEGPPCVFVFNRRGKLVKRFSDNVNYKEIEAVVVESLKD
jgi:thiol-disulfide isomerase/thioredoxin